MKAFLIQLTVFSVLLSGICTGVYYLGLFPGLLPSKRVYETIAKSKQKAPKVKRLIIGDSVGEQLFYDFNQDSSNTISLASNQAIDIIGQYILLYNYLHTNDHVKEVYLVYNPFSFKNNLDHEYTYNYFLKPFYKQEYKKHFTQNVLQQIEQVPFNDLVNFPPVAITFWTPEMKAMKEQQALFLSDISKEYLLKMRKLADSKQVHFKIVSPPIKESRKLEVETLSGIALSEFRQNEQLVSLFDGYFEQMQFLKDEHFVDQIHLKEPAKFTATFLSSLIMREENNLLATDEP